MAARSGGLGPENGLEVVFALTGLEQAFRELVQSPWRPPLVLCAIVRLDQGQFRRFGHGWAESSLCRRLMWAWRPERSAEAPRATGLRSQLWLVLA